MATTIDAPEPDFDVAPVKLTDEQIAKDRASAAAARIPDKPMDAAESEVIGHPSDSPNSFNSMADKLDKAMKEVLQQNKSVDPVKDKSTEPDTKQHEKPAAKNPAAPAEPAPEEKTITSAKAADWKAIKEKAKTFETQAKEYEQKHALLAKEYEEFKKKAVDLAKVEEANKKLAEIQADRDAIKKQLETVALERSDEFKKAFDSRFTEAISRAKDAAGSKAEQIESLMQLPPSKWRKEQINAIREELDGVDQGQLDVALSEYDRARVERENELKNGTENYKRLLGVQAERKNREKELEAHRIEAAISSVLSMAKEKYDSFKPGESEDTAKIAAANEDRVRRFYKGQLDPRELALMPILASEQERLTKSVIPGLEAKIKELEATVAEYDKSNPKPSGGGNQQHPAVAKGGSFIDTFKANWPGK